MLGGLGCMMCRVRVMALGQVSVMGCCLVFAFLVMPCRFPMVIGGVLMMLSGLRVMVRSFL